MTVDVSNISKRFGSFAALDNVNLEARPGEFLALLGPSGSGKTTLLRIMAGLDFADTGTVRFDGVDVSNRPTGKRAVGFVFQHYALFRHMTVTENVAFGLNVKPRRERPAAAEIARRVRELLDLVQLGHLADRYPSQLSGGQRQRVALARALAVGPRILLLDEPFGALDAKVRKDLRRWLRKIHDEMGLTSVFVTHDQEEALDLADRVVVMNSARIEQVDTPERVYDQPATAFVAEFIGSPNRFECRIEPDGVRIGHTFFPTRHQQATGDGLAFVRPHEFDIRPAGHDGALAATVRSLLRAGPNVALECETIETGKIIEVATPEVPDWVHPGAALELVPRRIRAYPALEATAA